MFITIQFPLFDKWRLQLTKNRVEQPDWHDISTASFVRYMGAIMPNQNRYNGPLDSDVFYCNASSVFNLCGKGDSNFYNSLQTKDFHSKIIFRRFQADGYFMAKFEIGFSDTFEETIDQFEPVEGLKTQFFKQINNYLACQLKIKIGSKLDDFVALGDAGKFLKRSYFWSTIKGKRDFNSNDPNPNVENINPNIIVQVDKRKFPLAQFGFEKVSINGVADNNFELYSGQIKYVNKYFSIWIIGVDTTNAASPFLKADFTSFSAELKSIRKNLLQIPVEAAILQKLNAKIQDFGKNPNLADFNVQWNLSIFLHKTLDKLTKNGRNNQDQNSLIKKILRTDFTTDSDQETNSFYEKLGDAINSFNTLPSNDQLDEIKKKINEKYTLLLNGKPKKTIYISSTFRDLKDYRADLIKLFQNELSKQFELCQIMEKMYDDGDFTPFSEDCTAAVAKSDIYLIILGNKVGSFPPNEKRTYTEIELDFAILNQKKMFCFMLDPFDEKEISDKAKHDEIIGKFKGRPTHKFKNYNELENLLLKHLYQLAFD